MQPDLSSVHFYGILDTGYVTLDQWLPKYDALVAGGAGLIQIRAKTETPEQRARLVDQVVCHRESHPVGTQPPLVVNDDLELAILFPGLGLHVGQDDVSVDLARERLGPDRILGLSTHSREQADAAMALGPGILSYFAVGPVFATPTKPDAEPVGLDLVRYVAGRQPPIPFYCIGGIKRGNLSEVIAAGGRRVVTVSDVLEDPDTAAATRATIEALSH